MIGTRPPRTAATAVLYSSINPAMLLTTLGHMHASDTASSHLAALTLLVLLPFLYPIKAAEVEAPFGKPRFQTPEAQYSGSSSQLLALVC
jgi:hypothetical protein